MDDGICFTFRRRWGVGVLVPLSSIRRLYNTTKSNIYRLESIEFLSCCLILSLQQFRLKLADSFVSLLQILNLFFNCTRELWALTRTCESTLACWSPASAEETRRHQHRLPGLGSLTARSLDWGLILIILGKSQSFISKQTIKSFWVGVGVELGVGVSSRPPLASTSLALSGWTCTTHGFSSKNGRFAGAKRSGRPEGWNSTVLQRGCSCGGSSRRRRSWCTRPRCQNDSVD